MKDSTLEYYDKNAEKFTSDTFDLAFMSNQDRFLNLLPKEASILDFGCGSGRDSRYFLSKNFKVTAVDGSSEMVKIAERNTGHKVKCLLFTELSDINAYDGIWACASILHCHRDELTDVINKMRDALKENGVIYTSFKYNHAGFEGIRNGRYFIDFDENTFSDFMKQVNGLRIEEEWISADIRPDRKNEKWLNLILRKTA